MAETRAKKQSWLRSNAVRISRLHFLYVFLLVAQTVIYDAWKLIAPNAVLNRWVANAGLLFVTIIVWYLAKNKVTSTNAYKLLIFLLIFADIGIASFNVYTQRGMASRAVFLYVIPIIISVTLLSRSALFAATALSVAAYTSTAIAYFVLNFNEGYKIELYGEVGFYSALLFIVASVLWVVTRRNHT